MCYNNTVVAPILATERGCDVMDILLSFLVSIIAGIVVYYICKWLVQHCANNSEYSTCYLHQSCVVVSQQCHRIASFLRLVLSQISGTVFHCYLGNTVLDGDASDN